MIRLYNPKDLEAVARIHEQFYANEFELPIFENFLQAFTIVEDGEVIAAGGIKTILEAIAIIDKNKPSSIKVNSLFEILEAIINNARRSGYDQIHASIINDEKWKRHLVKVGFHPLKGEMLVLTW